MIKSLVAGACMEFRFLNNNQFAIVEFCVPSLLWHQHYYLTLLLENGEKLLLQIHENEDGIVDYENEEFEFELIDYVPF